MRIHLVSDLHLDISKYLELPGGEVLIIAGDACEAKSLNAEFHSTRPMNRIPGSLPCLDFFDIECRKYQKVFYVLGNHEHYRGKYWKTIEEIKSVVPNNVTILENQYEEYRGAVFVGATLWTDMNKADPITLSTIKNQMNDYRLITVHQDNVYRKLSPFDTVQMHIDSKRFIEKTVQEFKDKPVVVITHMAPTFMGVAERFRGETLTNGAYCSDLSDLILDNENIKFWVHGHQHDPVDYAVGSTRVLSNPRGYLPWEEGNGFDSNFSFEV